MGPRAGLRARPAEGEAEGEDKAEAEVELQGSPRAKSRRNSRAESGNNPGKVLVEFERNSGRIPGGDFGGLHG